MFGVGDGCWLTLSNFLRAWVVVVGCYVLGVRCWVLVDLVQLLQRMSVCSVTRCGITGWGITGWGITGCGITEYRITKSGITR